MKDPAFLFYPSDFLTGTMFMNNEQIGIYIRLLCSQHQHGGMIDKVSFNSLVGENEIVRRKFIETEDGFYNERMMLEIDKRSKKSSNLSANAKLRWEKEKQLKSKSNAIALKKDMPIVNEDINKDVINIKEKEFDNFWNLYDKKVGSKDKIKEKFFRLSEEERKLIFLNLDKYVLSTPDKQYRKNPDTWMNQRGWEHEIILPNSVKPKEQKIVAPFNMKTP